MKYYGLAILFIVANFCYAWLNVSVFHWLQPFLIAVIYLYFTEDNPWIYYSFGLLAGLIVDSFSASFGLHTLSYLLVLFLLNNLQLFVFTSKNTGTITVLAIIGVIFFWFCIWFLNLIFPWSHYILAFGDWLQIMKYFLASVLLIVVMYIVYFNFRLKIKA